MPLHGNFTACCSTAGKTVVSRIFAAFDVGQGSKHLSDLCLELLTEQKEVWPELLQGYASLTDMRVREVPCNGFSVRIQHNPGRIRSTAADVGERHINKRPCFLCPGNLPEEQKGILYKNAYLILCNPAPVFSSHLTVACLDHRPQTIAEHIDTLLQLAVDFGPGWTILYNGPNCGASAPDHRHFQAIPSGHMPIEKEIRGEKTLAQVMQGNGTTLYRSIGLGREAIILEGNDPTAVTGILNNLLNALKRVLLTDDEPMMNIAGFYNPSSPFRKGEPMGGFSGEDTWGLVVFPRARHRPDAFYGEGNDRVMVSPAVIEMGGVIVTPLEKDFKRLDAAAVENIYREVSLDGKTVDNVIAVMT